MCAPPPRTHPLQPFHPLQVYTCAKLLGRFADTSLPAPVRRWGPTLAGLAVIPLIVHPIDHAVDWLMDQTYRPLTTNALETMEGEDEAAHGVPEPKLTATQHQPKPQPPAKSE